MEEEVLKSEKLESIGVLAGGIAHDFNNILAAIMGNVSLVKMRTGLDNKGRELLGEVEKAAARATALTKQLLTFSKGGAPVKKMASIPEIIRESASFALRGSNTRCSFDIPKDVWSTEVDEGQISHVFHNLIINADQAMPRGGIIEIAVRNEQVRRRDERPLDPGRYLHISVHDQGNGIPEEYLSKIFDPYFSTKHRGSGLGLATVYSIVKKHNGHVSVESQLGRGTAFHIYLPATHRGVSVSSPAEPVAVSGSGRVLVMDDEKMIRDLTVEMLESLGYEADAARDGAEAIERYRDAMKSGKPYAAVILDLTVPGGMGGQDAMRELLAIDPKVRGVVSSGYSADPVLSEYSKYGFSNVAAKPYHMEEISRVIHEVITGSNAD
jgi:CheY-like chemotaxis protein